MIFYLLVVPVLILSLSMGLYFRAMERHDKVLYSICQVRRDAMGYLRNNWQQMSREDYLLIKRLVEALNVVIHNFNSYKRLLFNLRKMVTYLREYEHFSKEVNTMDLPEEGKISELYEAAFIAYLRGFFSFTPLIKSELIVRVLIFLLPLLAGLGLRKLRVSAQKVLENALGAKEQALQLGLLS